MGPILKAMAFCLLTSLTLTNTSGATDKSNPLKKNLVPERNRSAEVVLVQHLLAKYASMGNVARPTYNSSRIMLVQFGMRLIQMDIIEKEQVLKTSVWFRARWVDEYLRWNPAEFGGLENIVLPWDQVWTPDIVLVNTAETEIGIRHADIMVQHNGAVVWSPHHNYKSGCLVDVTNYPYDQHTCHMWFQSMSRYSWQLDLWPWSRNPWDMETYLASFQRSQEWEVLSNTTERYAESRDVGVLLKFSRRVALRFTLTVQRRIGYTCLLLLLPCVFLGSMSLVVFCLPPERPDRHTLAISLFGSFMVLTLILVEVAPPTAASIPMLGKYYACNMTMVMVSVFLSAIVVNVSRRGDRREPIPNYVVFICVYLLARPLLLHSRISIYFAKTLPRGKRKLNHFNNRQQSEVVKNAFEIRPFTFGGNPQAVRPVDSAYTPSNSDDHLLRLDEKLHRIESLLSRSTARDDNIDWETGGYCDEMDVHRLRLRWRCISEVLDRLFFTIYLVIFLVCFLLYFPRPPKFRF